MFYAHLGVCYTHARTIASGIKMAMLASVHRLAFGHQTVPAGGTVGTFATYARSKACANAAKRLYNTISAGVLGG